MIALEGGREEQRVTVCKARQREAVSTRLMVRKLARDDAVR